MSSVTETPRRLTADPRRRVGSRSDRSWKGKAVIAFVGLASTIVSGYYSGLAAVGDRDRAQIERIAKLEERVENQYKSIVARLDEQKAREEQNRQDARADINGIRDEIMRMLREMRR